MTCSNSRNHQDCSCDLTHLEMLQEQFQQDTLPIPHLVEQERHSSVLEERSRIVRELHDTLAQSFVGIAMQLEAAEEILISAPEDARVYLTRAGNLAREGLVEAQRSLLGLCPQVLERNNLPSALKHCVEQLTFGNRMQVLFNVSGVPYALPSNIEENLFRISQEAFTNALKHSQASEIRLNLAFSFREVELRVWDNGRGFNSQITALGLGLTGMYERSKSIRAELMIDSQVGRGTEVVCRLQV